jgi:hypothetical protein
MSESIDVAPSASRGSGVSISADGCGTARGLKTAFGEPNRRDRKCPRSTWTLSN